jgi:hypothetical protein
MIATRALSKGIEKEDSPGVRCVLIRDRHHRVIEIAAAQESGSEKSQLRWLPGGGIKLPGGRLPGDLALRRPGDGCPGTTVPSDHGTYPEMKRRPGSSSGDHPTTEVTRGRTPRSGLPGDACRGMEFTRGWPSPGKIELPGDASTRFSSKINLPGDDVAPTRLYEMVIRRRPIVRRRARKGAGATVFGLGAIPG